MKNRRMTRAGVSGLLILSLLFPAGSFETESVLAAGDTVIEGVNTGQEEWNIQCLNAENAYEESKKASKIKVAVIDSGLDYDSDIPFAERKDFLGEEEQWLYQDYTGHGTSVAGLICARKNSDRITGISANAELYAARVLDGENTAPVERVVQAVRWAMEKKVNIIHFSFGTKEDDEELREVVQQAYDRGILLIAAAGNDGTAPEDESTVEYPAAYEEVLAVGASDTSNNKTEESSSGEELDVVAPGDRIMAAGAFGGLTVQNGTSMAAAQVTGVAAVLWGRHPNQSHEFIRGLIVGSANKNGIGENCGEGMVDYAQSKRNYHKMDQLYETYKKRGTPDVQAARRAAGLLEKTGETVGTHENVNYVNGLWAKDVHSGFVESGKNISIVKAGAMAPDHVKSMKGMGNNPCFHGRGNYFADTQYLLEAAREYLKAGKNAKVTLPKYDTAGRKKENFSSKDEDNKGTKDNENIEAKLKKSLKNFFAGCEREDKKYTGGAVTVKTNKQKGYALLGAAVHNATDAMSHSVCLNMGADKGGWRRVVHSPSQVSEEKADDCAASMWKKWLAQYQRTITGDNTQEWPLYPVYSKWHRELIIADDAEKLKAFSDISREITQNLIAIVNKKDSCYESMAAPLEKATDTTMRLDKLNEYWKQATGKEKSFSLNAAVTSYSLSKFKKKDFIIYLEPKDHTLVVENKSLSSKMLCTVSGTDKKGRMIFFTKGNGKKSKWSFPYKKLKNNRLNIKCYTPDKSKAYKMDAVLKVQFSRKGVKGVTGKKSPMTIELGKIKLILPSGYKIKKGIFLGWKISGRCFYIPPLIFTAWNAGKIVLKPIVISGR